MQKAIHLILIAGFVAVDLLLFHDFFKPGEITTPVQMVVGALSILVFVSSARALFDGPRPSAPLR